MLAFNYCFVMKKKVMHNTKQYRNYRTSASSFRVFAWSWNRWHAYKFASTCHCYIFFQHSSISLHPIDYPVLGYAVTCKMLRLHGKNSNRYKQGKCTRLIRISLVWFEHLYISPTMSTIFVSRYFCLLNELELLLTCLHLVLDYENGPDWYFLCLYLMILSSTKRTLIDVRKNSGTAQRNQWRVIMFKHPLAQVAWKNLGPQEIFALKFDAGTLQLFYMLSWECHPVKRILI